MRLKSNSQILLAEKMFLSLLPIQIMNVMTYSINGMIDSFIGSNFIGASAMAATGLMGPMLQLIGSVTGIIAVGTLIVTTEFIGKNEKEDARAVFNNSFLLTLLIAGIFSAVLLIFNKPIAVMAGGNVGNTFLSDYIVGISIFYVFQTLSGFFMNFLQILGEDKKSYLSIFIMIVCNAVFDILFIIKLNLGVFCLGLATGISYFIQMLVVGQPFLKKCSLFRIGFSKFRISEFLRVISNGLPSEIGWMANGTKGMIINYLLLSLGGTTAVAAMAVENTICGFLGAVVVGTSLALLITSTLFIAECDVESLSHVVKLAVGIGLVIVMAVMALIMIFSNQIAGIFYSNERAVRAVTARAILLFPVYLPANLLLFSILKVFQAQGMFKSASAFSLIEGFMPAVTAYVLSRFIKLDGIWLSIFAADLLMIVIIFIYVWMKQKKIPLSLHDIMLIPKDFGVADADRVSMTIYSLDEAVNLSERICAFCKNHGFDDKTSNVSGLAIEELSIISFKYSMKNIKRPQVDVRCIYSDDTLTLRMRDNGHFMFSNDQIKIEDPDDPAANIGIKIIRKLADDISVSCTSGLTAFTIKIKRKGAVQ